MDVEEEEEHVINWRREVEVDAAAKRRKCCPTWTHHHFTVFFLTFFSYALFHATRKNFSTVKSSMVETWMSPEMPNASLPLGASPFNDALETWECAKTTEGGCFMESGSGARWFQGILDACFLFSYAIGLYLSGMIGDRFDPRIVLSVGMWLSAILVILFGFFSELLKYYHASFYVVIWLLCGLVQASGWPTEVAVMGAWFGRGTRGAVLGLWSACASVGNIIGTEISAHFLPYGYEYTFLANGTLLFAGGIVIFFGLVPSSKAIGLGEPDEEKREGTFTADTERPKPISFIRAVLLPGVIEYSLAYACLKLVNYSLFFWLPTYINLRFGWSEEYSDDLSTFYDWGGIIGGFIGGLATDYMPFRSPLVIGFLSLSVGSLFGYSKAPPVRAWNRVLLGLCGFLIGGPANLISAAISADLGKQEAIRGSAEALATVTGIVDGTGSVGAALGQLIVPAIIPRFGLPFVFYFFIVMVTPPSPPPSPRTWGSRRPSGAAPRPSPPSRGSWTGRGASAPPSANSSSPPSSPASASPSSSTSSSSWSLLHLRRHLRGPGEAGGHPGQRRGPRHRHGDRGRDGERRRRPRPTHRPRHHPPLRPPLRLLLLHRHGHSSLSADKPQSPHRHQ